MRANWMYLLLGASLACCAVADEALSSDFLEFLGNGSRSGGQWIDPMSIHDSPAVFADLPTAKDDGEQLDITAQRPHASPPKDLSTPQRNDDGGNNDD